MFSRIAAFLATSALSSASSALAVLLSATDWKATSKLAVAARIRHLRNFAVLHLFIVKLDLGSVDYRFEIIKID